MELKSVGLRGSTGLPQPHKYEKERRGFEGK